MRETRFYLVAIGFTTGIFLRSFWKIDPSVIFFFGPLLILSTLAYFIYSKKQSAILMAIFILSTLIGIWRFQLADKLPPKSFSENLSQTTTLEAQVLEPPAVGDSGTKILVSATKSHEQAGIVLFTKHDQDFKYGDEIKVTGILELPKNFMTDQGLEFDYANYLRKDGFFFVMRNPNLKLISRGHGNPIKQFLFSFKETFKTTLNNSIPKPESTLMEGLILGDRSALSQNLKQAFMDTGTAHIITIGGYHVTLVAGWIMKLLSFLPTAVATSAGIISIFLYIVITGGAQTTIRAGIMATIALLAKATGRPYTATRALIMAAMLMILINPLVLVFDTSFQLSFIATIAIIFMSPKVKPYFALIHWEWVRDISSVTVSMYIFALPFVLFKMGSLSLVALPANFAIVPIMPLCMVLGFITGFAGLIFAPLGMLMGKFTYILLHYQILVINMLAHLPFATIAIQNFPLIILIIVYSIFAWIFLSKSKTRWTIVLPLFITLTTCAFLFYTHQQSIQKADLQMQQLLTKGPESPKFDLTLGQTKFNNCKINGPLPDHACTPGAIFPDATLATICVKGYTKTVRNVSSNLRQKIFAEYNISYPVPKGAYEIDHLIPLAIGGSNDISNLWPEAAEPTPGFHDKDVVEVYLQEQVCEGKIELSAAQWQIAHDWISIFNNMNFEKILQIKKKYNQQEIN